MAITPIDALIRRVAALESKVNKLIAESAVPVSFEQRAEVVSEAFERRYRPALENEENAVELTGTELADELGITCSPVAFGRALSLMGVNQEVRKRKGRSVRLYRVVKIQV